MLFVCVETSSGCGCRWWWWTRSATRFGKKNARCTKHIFTDLCVSEHSTYPASLFIHSKYKLLVVFGVCKTLVNKFPADVVSSFNVMIIRQRVLKKIKHCFLSKKYRRNKTSQKFANLTFWWFVTMDENGIHHLITESNRHWPQKALPLKIASFMI